MMRRVMLLGVVNLLGLAGCPESRMEAQLEPQLESQAEPQVEAVLRPDPTPQLCQTKTVTGTDYTICRVVDVSTIRVFHKDGQGRIFGEFEGVVAAQKAQGLPLRFAMNGGMYHADREPVGLYVEAGVQHNPISLKPGPGNFHMLPNGVFWIAGNGDGTASASVTEGQNWPDEEGVIVSATQSGPILVSDGALHPKFLPGGTSRKIRNGVGVDESGEVIFVKSETRVNFHDFATLFRDHLSTPNALYLDGTVSRLFIEGERNDKGYEMGPIIGVVASRELNGER